MGMYNDVILNIEQKCPKCGTTLDGWQSKYMTYCGYDLNNNLQKLKINSRISGEAHTFCDNCGEWVSLEIKKGKISKGKHHPTPYSKKSESQSGTNLC